MVIQGVDAIQTSRRSTIADCGSVASEMANAVILMGFVFCSMYGKGETILFDIRHEFNCPVSSIPCLLSSYLHRWFSSTTNEQKESILSSLLYLATQYSNGLVSKQYRL